MWVEPLEVLTCQNDRLCLSTPNEFFIRRLKDNYLGLFEQAFLNLGHPVRIEFKARASKKRPCHPINGSDTVVTFKKHDPAQAFLPGFDPQFHCGRLLKKGTLSMILWWEIIPVLPIPPLCLWPRER